MTHRAIANALIANQLVDSCLESELWTFLAIQSTAELPNASFSYTYTIGRTDHRLPEAIMTRPLPEAFASEILNLAIREAPPEIQPINKAFELTLSVSPTPRRFKWMLLDLKTAGFVKKDLMPVLVDRYAEDVVKKIEVYQLLFADANNVLPGERGYITELDQVILIAA